MHEEATSMNVPSSVAASTQQNGTASVDVELDPIANDNSISDNVELQVSYSSNSAGFPMRKYLERLVIPQLIGQNRQRKANKDVREIISQSNKLI